NNKTIYLTDTYGGVEVAENYSWDKIYADLFIDTIQFDVEKKYLKQTFIMKMMRLMNSLKLLLEKEILIKLSIQ
ncbi:peptide ABC transporter ATP-binding protein, partial [Acinetobacter baumannii]